MKKANKKVISKAEQPSEESEVEIIKDENTTPENPNPREEREESKNIE